MTSVTRLLVHTLAVAGVGAVDCLGVAQADSADDTRKVTVMAQNDGGSADGVSGLPYAGPGQTFASLDDYVAHRARVSAMGGPTLREIAPDRFVEEFQGGQVNHYTRAELLAKLGFKR